MVEALCLWLGAHGTLNSNSSNPTIERGLAVVTQDTPVKEFVSPDSNGFFQPSTDFEREKVRNQLDRLLASRAFHHSKRYAAVLKYIVDQTLEGCGDQLKERTIGIDVFKRAPDYDTATDHVVRSAAAEVRKRLAQHYLQNSGDRLRIEVLPGSYVPQFRWAGEDSAAPLVAPAPRLEPARRKTSGSMHRQGTLRGRLRPSWLAAACLVLFVPSVALMVAVRLQDPFESFWRPVLSSHAPVVLCVGNLAGARTSPSLDPSSISTMTLSDFHSLDSETVHLDDAITLAKFAGLMQARGKQFQLVSQSDATYTDLQHGPAILVGLMNNTWTERLLPSLRYTIVRVTPTKVVIRDRENPSRMNWSIDYATPYLDVTRDYALVMRMTDPETEKPVVVVAGITVFGTFAAGNFLTNKSEMRKLAAIAPPGWEKKNMELVLSTDVIRGRSGPATIVASQFW